MLKTRIAPTPSGFLHIGNAFNFLLAETLAKQIGAKILLRIDDIDTSRKRTAYVEDIFETINWLQINIDEGPSSIMEFEQQWSQQKRHELYIAALNKLKNKQMLFTCECSRSKLKNLEAYPNFCLKKQLPFEQPQSAWRIKMNSQQIVNFSDKLKGFQNIDIAQQPGAFVVKTKNESPSYQLASVVDDTHFGITHIVRGEDLLNSTAQQLYLATHLEQTNFLKSMFYHHPLLTSLEGKKLSKSAGSDALNSLRKKGYRANEIRNQFLEWHEKYVLENI